MRDLVILLGVGVLIFAALLFAGAAGGIVGHILQERTSTLSEALND